jgi:asparagine synthase (glutamine-hydrolysing)
MPGLCGCTVSLLKRGVSSTDVAARMASSLVYRPYHTVSTTFTDDCIAGTSVSLAPLEFITHRYEGPRAVVWVDGERFPDTATPQISFAEELHNAFAEDTLADWLAAIDAVFAAVIYDPFNRKLHFISDRFGLRQFYLCITPAGIAWATELKAFRQIPSLQLQIDPAAVNEFLSVGHGTGCRTWYKKVELIAPAQVVEWNCTLKQLHSTTYWSPDDIPPLADPPDSPATLEKLSGAFRNAVEKRCRSGEKVGVGLSGGLDSRAIFAALPRHTEPVPAVTFGKPGCPDITIARRVAALRPSNHHVHEITTKNWLDNRIEAIRLTDGQFNMLHMHGIEHIDELHDLHDIELNGFLGDALLGGSYANHPDGEYSNFLNRGRRFIAAGLYLGSIAYHTRLPFFDRGLIELTLAIPTRFRRNSTLYNRMLLQAFPEYFSAIPWQKTGIPISRTSPLDRMAVFARKGIGKLRRTLPLLNDQREFFDYGSWIRSEPGRSFFQDTLTAADSPLFTYVDRKEVQATLARHFRGADRSEVLGRWLTVAVWLREVQTL